jgi:hypothetical protein
MNEPDYLYKVFGKQYNFSADKIDKMSSDINQQYVPKCENLIADNIKTIQKLMVGQTDASMRVFNENLDK